MVIIVYLWYIQCGAPKLLLMAQPIKHPQSESEWQRWTSSPLIFFEIYDDNEVTWKSLQRFDGPYTSSLQNLVTPMYSRPIQFSVRFLKTHIQFGIGTLLPFRGAIAATQAGDANYLFRWSPLRVACCCDTICARRLMLTKRC